MTTETTGAAASHPAWVCPACGSADLRVFYSERRVCRVTTRADGPGAAEPWPSYEGDAFVDIDPTSFTFHCATCDAYEIIPSTTGHGGRR